MRHLKVGGSDTIHGTGGSGQRRVVTPGRYGPGMALPENTYTYRVTLQATTDGQVEEPHASALNASIAASHDGEFVPDTWSSNLDGVVTETGWHAALTVGRMQNPAVAIQAAIGVIQRESIRYGRVPFLVTDAAAEMVPAPVGDEE